MNGLLKFSSLIDRVNTRIGQGAAWLMLIAVVKRTGSSHRLVRFSHCRTSKKRYLQHAEEFQLTARARLRSARTLFRLPISMITAPTITHQSSASSYRYQAITAINGRRKKSIGDTRLASASRKAWVMQ